MFYKKGVLKNFTKFTGKHLCLSLFFKSLLKNFIKKETLAQVFPLNFENFLRTFFLQNTSGQLLLKDSEAGKLNEPFSSIFGLCHIPHHCVRLETIRAVIAVSSIDCS